MKHKFIVIILLLAAISFVNFKFNHISPKLPLINKVFPQKLGDWQGENLIAADNVYKMIPKDQLLMRLYKNTKNQKVINLSIVLTDERETIHDPQICYRGQGFDMTKQKVISLTQKNKVHYVYAIKNKEPYTIIYWYTDLKQTFPERVGFMSDITLSKFWNRPLKGFGLVIITAPRSIEQDVIHFAETTNKLLFELDK